MARTQEQIDALLDRLESFFSEYDNSVETFNKDEYKKRNGEKLGKYSDIMKKLNGENFDLFEESYKEYTSDFSSLDEESYLAKLTMVLDEQIADLKDALGVSEVEIKSDEEGTEIVADDNEVNSEKVEEPTEEKVEEKIEEVDGDEEEDEEAELDRIAKSIKKPF